MVGISQDQTQKSPDPVSNSRYSVCDGVPILTGNTNLKRKRFVNNVGAFLLYAGLTHCPELPSTDCPFALFFDWNRLLGTEVPSASSTAIWSSCGIGILCFRKGAASTSATGTFFGDQCGFSTCEILCGREMSPVNTKVREDASLVVQSNPKAQSHNLTLDPGISKHRGEREQWTPLKNETASGQNAHSTMD